MDKCGCKNLMLLKSLVNNKYIIIATSIVEYLAISFTNVEIETKYAITLENSQSYEASYLLVKV